MDAWRLPLLQRRMESNMRWRGAHEYFNLVRDEQAHGSISAVAFPSANAKIRHASKRGPHRSFIK